MSKYLLKFSIVSVFLSSCLINAAEIHTFPLEIVKKIHPLVLASTVNIESFPWLNKAETITCCDLNTFKFHPADPLTFVYAMGTTLILQRFPDDMDEDPKSTIWNFNVKGPIERVDFDAGGKFVVAHCADSTYYAAADFSEKIVWVLPWKAKFDASRSLLVNETMMHRMGDEMVMPMPESDGLAQEPSLDADKEEDSSESALIPSSFHEKKIRDVVAAIKIFNRSSDTVLYDFPCKNVILASIQNRFTLVKSTMPIERTMPRPLPFVHEGHGRLSDWFINQSGSLLATYNGSSVVVWQAAAHNKKIFSDFYKQALRLVDLDACTFAQALLSKRRQLCKDSAALLSNPTMQRIRTEYPDMGELLAIVIDANR